MNDKETPSPRIGTWLSIGSPTIAELAAESGFDWVLLDLEHGCAPEASLPDQLRALRGSSTTAIVRVGAPHPDLVARVLDWGAGGIMVPHVESVAQAEAVVRAAHYPPRGQRGLSRTVRAYGYGLRPPQPDMRPPLILAQIESAAAVDQATEIARVDGIDILFVGPADLRFDLQVHGATLPDEYDRCLRTVVDAAGAAGKTSGILVRNPGGLDEHASLGFSYIAIDSDLAILRKAYQDILSD